MKKINDMRDWHKQSQILVSVTEKLNFCSGSGSSHSFTTEIPSLGSRRHAVELDHLVIESPTFY